MSRSKWSTRRKSLAIGLAVVGVAGLSLASASQINFNWNTQSFQSGSVPTVMSDCQKSTVGVAYGTPAFSSTGWTVSNVTFSSIDTACQGKTYEVAYSTSSSNGWVQTGLTTASAKVDTTGSIAVALPSGVTDPSTITGWALTIHS